MTAGPDDLAGELAREIRAAVAQAAPPGRSPVTEREANELEDVRTPLRRAEEHLTPTVPEAARFFGAKSAVIRLLKFLWRSQASFNALVLEAGNGVAAALEQNRTAIEELTGDLAGWREEARRRDSDQDARIAYLETVPERANPVSPRNPPAQDPGFPESVYALFEERFRGSPSDVAQKQKFYLPFLRNVPGPVFDAGCGRGEFLRLLQEERIAACGVEASSLAAETCRAAGLDVREGDAVDALAATPSSSLGAVVAFQVVEHWPAAQTFRFLAQARRAVAAGGLLIVETVNTGSLSAMNAFYLDPTHIRPVPPEALSFLCEAAGFRDLRVEFLSPLADSERLVERSENDVRVNEILFGPQDYAVIARVPTE